MDRYSRKIRLLSMAQLLKNFEEKLKLWARPNKPKSASDWPVDANGVHYYTHHSASRGRRYS
jgi:hypothetical protein